MPMILGTPLYTVSKNSGKIIVTNGLVAYYCIKECLYLCISFCV